MILAIVALINAASSNLLFPRILLRPPQPLDAPTQIGSVLNHATTPFFVKKFVINA
jgi:hypothetical protein